MYDEQESIQQVKILTEEVARVRQINQKLREVVERHKSEVAGLLAKQRELIQCIHVLSAKEGA